MMGNNLKKIEEENTYLRNRLTQIEAQAKIGLWDLDIVKNTLKWSDYTYTLFEIDRSNTSLTVDMFVDVVHPDDREMVSEFYDKSLENQEPYEIVHRLLLKDGSVKMVRERCHSTFDNTGKPLMSYGTVQDITQYMHEEEQKRKSEQKMFKLSQLAALGELASGVAHEINNPLAILKGYHDMKSKWVSEYPDGEFKKKLVFYMERETEAIERVRKVVSSLKSYNYSGDDSPVLFSVGDEIQTSIDFIKVIYEKNGILITLENCNKMNFIKGYPNYLQQILMNLYSNARDALYGQEGARIDVTCTPQDDKVCIVVKDNGSGIDDNNLDNIFQLDFSTKQKGEGTGFGLHLVEDFVRRMDGTIRVESKVSVGTSFHICFPVDHVKEMEMPKEFETEEVIVQQDKTIHCLVVDDEIDIAEYLSLLIEAEGHTADFTTSGADALEKISTTNYDCIFTDIVMPDMNGQALLRKLTQRKFKGKRVIVSGNFFPQGKSAVLNYDVTMEKRIRALAGSG